jgi:glycosyltransferase involved in cell wall biosynthesis
MVKKVLFVIDNLSTGGAQRQMVNLATGLQNCGYQVEFFCYAEGDLLAKPLYQAGIPIHRHIKASRYSFDVIRVLRKLIRDNHYDLALSFLATPNFYTILAGRLAGRNLPIVVSERFCDLPGGVPRTERISRQFYRFANHVTVNSHHQRENLARKYPYLNGRLSTIYNGYDLDAFYPPEAEPLNDPLRLLTIASVSPYKNGLCLIEALHILREKYHLAPSVDWIGQRLRQGIRLEYLNMMEAKIAEYGLESQWQWLDQRSDIVEHLHQHDLRVHPSFGEGLPNVVCEALACGRPVIVSNVLDHARLVQDNVSGYLFDVNHPEELAEKIYRFANLSAGERRVLGQNGRQFAEKNLSLSRFVNDYDHLFQNLQKEG